jgi:hypothetical protein
MATKYLNAVQVSKILGVSRQTIHVLAKNGAFAGTLKNPPRGQYRIPSDSVEAYKRSIVCTAANLSQYQTPQPKTEPTTAQRLQTLKTLLDQIIAEENAK